MKFFLKVVFAFLLLWVPLASAQQITGRFYPEKQQYLVGEPIIVVFEVVNNSAKVVEVGESNCPNPHQFEVDNALAKRRIELYGCAEKPIGLSCLGSSREIPGESWFRAMPRDEIVDAQIDMIAEIQVSQEYSRQQFSSDLGPGAAVFAWVSGCTGVSSSVSGLQTADLECDPRRIFR